MCNLAFLVHLDLATLSLAGNAARQSLLMAASHEVSYCVKRGRSQKEALLPPKRKFSDSCRNIGHFLCGRKDKAFGDRPFALHRQQHEQDTVFIQLLSALDCKPHQNIGYLSLCCDTFAY